MLYYLVFILLSALFYVLYFFKRAVRPHRMISPVLPSHLGLNWKNIIFETTDCLQLKGWLIPHPEKRPLIIICHGFPFDKGDILLMTYFLAQKFSLLLFDFRAHGESQGNLCTFGIHERKDLDAVLKWVLTHHQGSIGILGVSMGASITAMKNHDKVGAHVLDCGYAELEGLIHHMFRHIGFLKFPLLNLLKGLGHYFLKIDLRDVSPRAGIRHSKIPALIIHGTVDEQTPVENAYQLKEAHPDAELWICDEAGHAESHAKEPALYKKKIWLFFEKHLGS